MEPRKFHNPNSENTLIINDSNIQKSLLSYCNLANLLYKTKPHHREDRTMRIHTMRGLAVKTISSL